MAKRSAKKKAPGAKPLDKKPATGKTATRKKQAKPGAAVASDKGKSIWAPGGIVAPDALRVLDTATYLVLHLLVVAVPLAFGQITFDQFDMPKVVTLRFISLALIGLWLARFLLSKKTEVRRTPLDWFVLAFLVWVTLSTILSVHLPTALLGKYRRYEGFISLVNYAAVFFIAVQTLRDYRRLLALSKTMVIVGALVSLYGIAQGGLGKDFMTWGQLPFDQFRAFATYGNPDLLVGYLAFLVPVAMGLYLVSDEQWESILYGICGALIVLSMLLTFSRSAWVGLFFALIYAVALFWRQRMLTHKRIIVAAACVLVIIAGLGIRTFNSPMQATSLYARLGSLLRPNEGSAGTRLDIWQSAIDATKDRPVFGFGPDTFRLVFPRYKTAAYVQKAGFRSVADNVHNYPLQLASSIGIPGLLLFAALLGYGIYKGGRFSMQRDGDRKEKLLVGSFVAAAIAYAGHLVFGLSVTGTTIFLWLAFAAYMMPLNQSREIDWTMSSGLARSLALSLVGVLVLTGFYFNGRFLAADQANLRSYQYQSTNTDQALAEETRALQLNPYWDAYRAQKAMLLLTVAQQSGDKATLEAAIDFLRQSIKESPREYDNYLFLANAYSMAARIIDPKYEGSAVDEAFAAQSYEVDDASNVPETALGVALYAIKNVEPNAPSAMVQAATSYATLGQPAKALPLAESAARVDPGYAEAFYQVGVLNQSLGNKQKALAALKKAIALREEAGQGDYPEAADAIKQLEAKSN